MGSGSLMQPNQARGESVVSIDGEDRIIRMDLNAQARIVAALDVEAIEAIPDLLRQLDPKTMATMISCSLVEADLSVDEIMGAHMPIASAMDGLITACNLAFWGSPDGPPRTPEEEGET